MRDLPGLIEADIPVFARGHSPNAGYRNGPGEVNLGVTCGGIHIGAGDILVGDVDGVVAIPLASAQAVAARLELVRQKEADSLAKVRAGQKLQFWNEAASRIAAACATSTDAGRSAEWSSFPSSSPCFWSN